MIRVTIDVDDDNVIGVKETLASALERFGDVKVVDVTYRNYHGRGPDTIGTRIRKARMGESMTQWELAERLHVSESTVAYWETDRRNPKEAYLLDIAKICHVRPGWLMCKPGESRKQ